MNAKVRSITLLLLTLAAASALAQGKPGAEPSPAPALEVRAKPAPEKRERGELVNVRIEANITDRRGSQAPITKTVSLVVADRGNGLVRSTSQAPVGSGANANVMEHLPLNIDANPRIEDGRVRVRLSLEYAFVDRSGGELRFPKMDLRKSLDLVLESGKPVVVAESADPISDRRVTLEVKATILR